MAAGINNNPKSSNKLSREEILHLSKYVPAFAIIYMNREKKNKYGSLNLESFTYSCWRRQWHPTPVLLPGKSHGWRSLVGYSPWRRVGHDWTTSLSLSCSGEGNGHPLQYSCPENPRDRGAWWAAVYGVAQSRTRLKWLSSSSSLHLYMTTGKTRIFDYMDFGQPSDVSAF